MVYLISLLIEKQFFSFKVKEIFSLSDAVCAHLIIQRSFTHSAYADSCDFMPMAASSLFMVTLSCYEKSLRKHFMKTML